MGADSWLWVDFGDIAADGTTESPLDYAPDGVPLVVGTYILLGDHEGNRADGSVVEVYGGPRGDWVRVRVHEIRMAGVAP